MEVPKTWGNQWQQKWTEEVATEFMEEALELSLNEDYDFIGEVAKELGVGKDHFNYLIKQYPVLEGIHKLIKSNLESNCYNNGKKGAIVPSLAIMNLKSNSKWTDRIDQTTDGKALPKPEPITFTKKKS